jgi:AraC-like DNA-binding protein
MIIAQAVEGNYEISVAGNPSENLCPGDAFLSPPGAPLKIIHHCNQQSGVFRLRWIHVNVVLFDAINLCEFLQLPQMIKQPWAERIGKLADKICLLQKEDDKCKLTASTRITIYAFQAIETLLNYLAAEGIYPAFNHDMSRMLPALKLLENGLSKHIQAGNMAKSVNLSLPRFHVEFKRLFGVPPMEFLRRRRLAKAANMLKSTSLSLKEIAHETGFCNQFHFSREFRRHYNEAPSSYRKYLHEESMPY